MRLRGYQAAFRCSLIPLHTILVLDLYPAIARSADTSDMLFSFLQEILDTFHRQHSPDFRPGITTRMEPMASIDNSMDDALPIPIEDPNDAFPTPIEEPDDSLADDEATDSPAADELLQHPHRLPDGRLPLCIAAARGDSRVLQELLTKGVAVDAQDKDGRTALSYAAQAADVKMMQELLKAGADINAEDKSTKSKGTALLYAVQAANLTLVDEVSKRRAKLEYISGYHWSKDVQSGHLEAVGLLSENGADVNAQDTTGRTALSHAAQACNLEMVKLLLDYKPDIKKGDNKGRTAFSWVASPGKVRPTIDGGQSWIEFPSLGHARYASAHEKRTVDVLERLERADGDCANTIDKTGRTPLSWAARNGSEEMVRYICEFRKNEDTQPFKPDKQGRSALSFAAEAPQNNAEVIQILLKTNIFIDDSDHEYRTPLHWLHRTDRHNEDGYIKREETEILGLLGFPLSPLPPSDPFHRALKDRPYHLSSNEIHYLNRSVKKGKTILSYAVANSDICLVKVLCNIRGLRAHIKNDDDNETALMTALKKGEDEMIKIVVSKGNIEKELQNAVELGRSDLMGSLLVYASYGRRWALESVLENPKAPDDALVELLEKVLEVSKFQADELDQKLRSGRRPLEAARDRGSNGVRLVQVLLSHGANPKIWSTLNDWTGHFGHTEEYLVKLSKPAKQVTPLSYGFEYVTREALEQTVPDDNQTVFFAHTPGHPWEDPHSIPAGGHYTVHEIELKFQPAEDIKTCSLRNQMKIDKTPWGVRWVVKGRDEKQIPVIYESKLRKVWIPEGLQDLLEQLLREFDDKWESYCHITEMHLNGHRSKSSNIHETRGRIDGLENDIYYLAELRSGLQRQVRVIQEEFVHAFDDSSPDLKHLQTLLRGHKLFYNERLDRFEQAVSSLLQLEYTRHSVEEADTISRISQFTFIYLPLMFASSLFGMNVDILRDNPGWYWYLLVATVFLSITYILYRRDRWSKWVQSRTNMSHQATRD
ncbi:ankyrin repeat-containing domain protein [Aspergillus heterothallicus]